MSDPYYLQFDFQIAVESRWAHESNWVRSVYSAMEWWWACGVAVVQVWES